ncbi:YrzA family protein [Bacillus timonensis]|nr:YrzA family protein [Bacillus timonensis]
MEFKLDIIQDKVELFEAYDIKTLEKKINEHIEHNKAILLEVHSASHQVHVTDEGKTYFTALVHFKVKK